MAQPALRETTDTADLSRGRWAPRRLRAILRREGAAGLLGRTLERLGWRRAGLYVGGLDEVARVAAAAAAAAADAGVEVVRLGAGDAPAYLAFRPGPAAGADFAARLRAGHACFAARHEGRVLAATWVAVGPARVDTLRREFRPAPGEIYLFDGFTAAGCRGRRLAAAIVAAVAATYRRRGYRSAVLVIAPHNRSSRRSYERSGFRRRAVVHSFARDPVRTADLAGGPGGGGGDSPG
jgi:ribosomal protein S18 acetylase RimI-like enzyme